MAQKVWIISFNIRKVNGDSYPVPQEMVREYEENIVGVIRKSAERIAEQFDFPYVEVTARSTDDGKTYTFKHQSDEGYRKDWQVGPPIKY
jgi:hypothetical protein